MSNKKLEVVRATARQTPPKYLARGGGSGFFVVLGSESQSDTSHPTFCGANYSKNDLKLITKECAMLNW